MSKRANRYRQIIEKVFAAHYQPGIREFVFQRQEIVTVAADLDISLPKNLGDVIYSFRYRSELPPQILETAAQGETWIIRGAGQSQYRFVMVPDMVLAPNPTFTETKIPDATPGIVNMYALSDEQALLAKLRYNRLIDTFARITCYSLQNHLRTNVRDVGQVETDELYVGVDRQGVQYVLPVQAKGGNDRLSIVQIEQDFALCAHKFPLLVCRPIGAQFIDENTIALFEFEIQSDAVRVNSERHYRLVPPAQISDAELIQYRQRLSDDIG